MSERLCSVLACGFSILLFLDHDEDLAGPLSTQDRRNSGGALNDIYLLPAQTRGGTELFLQIAPVGDDDDLELSQLRRGAHLAHEEDHRQRLTGPLRMPDDPATLVLLPVNGFRLTIQEAV